MKKQEIKSVGVVSLGKTVIYLMLIPMALILLIGFFVLLIGILIQQTEVALIGGAYLVLPIFMLAIYGGLSMLMGLIYNWLAGKFGGLQITLDECKSTILVVSSPDANLESSVNVDDTVLDSSTNDPTKY